MKESLGLLKPSLNSTLNSTVVNEDSAASNDTPLYPVSSTSSSVATASNLDFVCVTPLISKSSNISQKPSLSPLMAKSPSPVTRTATSPSFLKATSTPLAKNPISKDPVESPISFALKPPSQPTSTSLTSPVTSKNILLHTSNMSSTNSNTTFTSMSTSSMSSLSAVPTASSTSTSSSTTCQSRPQITKSKTSTTSLPALLRNRSLRKLRLLNNTEDSPFSTSNSATFSSQQQPHQKYTSVSSPTVATLQSIKSPAVSNSGNVLPPSTLQLQPVSSGLNASSIDVPISPIAATAAEAAAVVVQVMDNNNNNPASNNNSRNNSEPNIIVPANNVSKPTNNSKGTTLSSESNEINSAVPTENLSLDTSNVKLDLLPPNPLMSPVSEDQLSPVLPSRLTSPIMEPDSFFFSTHNDTIRSVSLNNALSDRHPHPNFSSTQIQYSNNYHFFNEDDELALEKPDREQDNETQQTDDDFENSISIQRSSCNNLTSRSRQNSLATSLSSSTNNVNNNNGNLNMNYKVPTILSNNPIVASVAAPQPSFFQHHRSTKTSTSSCSFSANNSGSNNINTTITTTTTTTTNTSNEVLNIIYDDSLVNSTISSNTSMSTKSNTNSGIATTNSEALLGYFNDPILSNMINNNKDLINGNGTLSAGNDDIDEDTKYYELEEAFCDEIAFDILGKVEHIDDLCDRSNEINVFGDEDYSLRMKNGYEW